MDAELAEYLDRKFGEMDKRFADIDKRFADIDKRFDGIEQRFVDMDTKFMGMFAVVNSRIDGLAVTMATEVGSLHSEIRSIDTRLRREASLSTTLMDLTVKQSRWHEETDNAVADSLARQTDFSHKLAEMPAIIEDLRGRIEKLEQGAS